MTTDKHITTEQITTQDLETVAGGAGTSQLFNDASAIENGHGWNHDGTPKVPGEGHGVGAYRYAQTPDGGQWAADPIGYNNYKRGKGWVSDKIIP